MSMLGLTMSKINQEIELKLCKSYTDDGFDTCFVELDIVGCANSVFIEIPFNSDMTDEDIQTQALDTIDQMKGNDASVESLNKVYR